jgi:hypothetical protein
MASIHGKQVFKQVKISSTQYQDLTEDKSSYSYLKNSGMYRSARPGAGVQYPTININQLKSYA